MEIDDHIIIIDGKYSKDGKVVDFKTSYYATDSSVEELYDDMMAKFDSTQNGHFIQKQASSSS
jgi:roadblock/LC7 domain-containing protein